MAFSGHFGGQRNTLRRWPILRSHGDDLTNGWSSGFSSGKLGTGWMGKAPKRPNLPPGESETGELLPR